ncbi:hypothetical protein RFI_17540 [Reticulomyxa filosa]|uniref:Vps52 C-terminal domain-containing protein n=1 Tax=Reticulomyxa filosa TaxID=46433 RepID=X6N0T4_RETFI|nr:hypothetical protein RFI_17540 [Reticulomyxa filosa]|eukprot:ETO19691.1 hypothetical protein RFI_17540 [Reticulomyxa filosa]
MNKVYMLQFRTYIQVLSRHKEMNAAEKNDLMGMELSDKSTVVVGLFQSSKKYQNKEYLNEMFTLSKTRMALLKDFAKSTPLVTQMIEMADQRFPYEVLFQSYLRLLSDTVAFEYRFLSQFFFNHNHDMIDSIFDKILLLFSDEFDVFRLNSFDSLQLLLMIRLLEMVNLNKLNN